MKIILTFKGITGFAQAWKFALKWTWKTHKGLEKSLNFTITGGFNTVFGDLNQYYIVVPLFGAAPNKGTTILY